MSESTNTSMPETRPLREAFPCVDGFRIAHAEHPSHKTGASVVICPDGATGGVDVRGGAPATRETDLLKPEQTVDKIHSVVLSGGSVFGLSVHTGVCKELAREGIGLPLAGLHFPIVCGACLFDLHHGKLIHPDHHLGTKLVQVALARTEEPVRYDTEDFIATRTGAASGARIGKILGIEHSSPSFMGFGAWSYKGLKIQAIVALNAFGDVFDPHTQTQIAGVRTENGFMHTTDLMYTELEDRFVLRSQDSREHTTLACVMTNASLDKGQCTKLASMLHDAFARCIRPVHTSKDDDCIFALSHGNEHHDIDLIAELGNRALEDAIVMAAQGHI